MTTARKLYGDDDERMAETLVRYGESPSLADDAELWMVGSTEVLWLPKAHLGAVLCDGQVIWHRHVEPKDAAQCPHPHVDANNEGFLCEGHWEDRHPRTAERR
jgi:hypothetical protein